MAKAAKEAVYFVSSEGSGAFYTKRRNKKKGKGEKKLSLRKYDPKLRKHVKFDEKKLSKVKKKVEKAAAPAAEAAN
jgi:large subunit ribosomal protein L33